MKACLGCGEPTDIPWETCEECLPPRAIRCEMVDAMARATFDRALAPKNLAKGIGWHKLPLADLLVLLRKEVDELAEAVLSGAPPEHVRHEAGDVAWSAAIVADAVHAWGKR